MNENIKLQGRQLNSKDIGFIRELIEKNPLWSRRKISIALSQAWNWRNAKGDLKDMASRTLLVKLQDRGYLQLPPRRVEPCNRMRERQIPYVLHDTTPIEHPLKLLRPLKVINLFQEKTLDPLFSYLLKEYHYLGFSSPVGENMKYLIKDAWDRPLACLLFGSSAWSCSDRDKAIGWDRSARERNLYLTTNNTRFCILPWVRVPHLASHILGLINRQINQDWQSRYGHPVVLLETFVDQRFKGSSYLAANWRRVGETQGRSRNDRYNHLKVPVKSVFIYPLVDDYREKLKA